jgi:ABC-2 type transport system ATP-binding protein
MIEVRDLTKRYGPTLAVDGLTFDVAPGQVTGFLGPNGAGKSTTLRLMLGLQTPTRGRVTIAGTPYTARRRPLHEVGAMLESAAVHPGRTARHHLLALAQANGIPPRRVEEVLDLVGLADAAGRRAGGFSLGMTQRLGIAAALLGDPQVLLLDEPVNGLDPDGIVWIRTLLRSLAGEGRTVFLSSHLMSEMAQTADHLIVLHHGRLLADTSLEQFLRISGIGCVRVRAPQQDRLADLLRADKTTVHSEPDGALTVYGTDTATVGGLAHRHHIELHELAAREASLEEAFMTLTSNDRTPAQVA